MRSPDDTKVFGIGLSRTGTTSLHIALGLLGYSSVHYPPVDRLNEVIGRHDAATDTSVACCYKELDVRYPQSRFILTVRDVCAWSESAARYFAAKVITEPWQQEVRLRVYGSLKWDERTWVRAYVAHNADVVQYFARRAHDLLVLDVCGGGDWTKICRFLGRAEPAVPFPHANRYPDPSTRRARPAAIPARVRRHGSNASA